MNVLQGTLRDKSLNHGSNPYTKANNPTGEPCSLKPFLAPSLLGELHLGLHHIECLFREPNGKYHQCPCYDEKDLRGLYILPEGSHGHGLLWSSRGFPQLERIPSSYRHPNKVYQVITRKSHCQRKGT